MHSEILNDKQKQLLPLIAQFQREYYLVGGTAIADISNVANKIFGELYSEKMFRTQLCYFEDIDYTEKVDYLISNPPTDDEVKLTLTNLSIEGI